MRPIFELGSRRFRTGDEEDDSAAREDLDLTWLTFAVLDAVSELTEYSIGATRNEVLERVLPQARRQAAIVEADSKEVDEKISDDLNKVFDHLVNRGNRYLPFMTVLNEGNGKIKQQPVYSQGPWRPC